MPAQKKYVYIGEYFHRKRDDWQPPAEKKIGITDKPRQRERESSHTKGTIAFMILAAWDVGGRAREVENIFQEHFGKRRVLGEWFYDEEVDLIDEVANLMGINPNYKRVDLNKLRDATDAKQNGSEAGKIVKQARKRAANKIGRSGREIKATRDERKRFIYALAGKVFKRGTRGVQLTLEHRKTYWYCRQTKGKYRSGLTDALRRAEEDHPKITWPHTVINPCADIRDRNGKHPDYYIRREADKHKKYEQII